MDWSEVSAPVPVLAAPAQVPVPQAPGPVLVLVQPAVRLPALALAQVQALAQAWVPELASARAPVQVPGLQPLAARPWGLLPSART
jgi:hypothetical protein